MSLPSPPDGTVSQHFPPAPLLLTLSVLWVSVITQRQSTEECTKVCLNQEFITFPMSVHCLCLCYLLCLHPCLCLLCVALQCELHLLRPEAVFFFVCFTLYSWTIPFCSSSGGGCQETTMAVPLSPLSATVTSRGGALGAEGGRQKIKKHTFIHDFFPLTACSLSRLVSSHLAVRISVWDWSWGENKGLIFKITMLLSENWACLIQVPLWVNKSK